MKLEIVRCLFVRLFVCVDGLSIRIWMRGICWIDLTQDSNRRRAVVNAVMNIHLP
jgi:hypothetical protein